MRECEEMLKIVQRSKDSRLDLAGGSRLASHQKVAHVPSMPEAEESQAGQAVSSRLELTTQPSREVKLPDHPVWEKLTFHIPSHPTIYRPLYPRTLESF